MPDNEKQFATLGAVQFVKLKSFLEFSKQGGVTYAEHKPLDGKPRLQPTGNSLDELSITMRLHNTFCKPAEELKILKRYRDTFEVLPLVWGNGKVEGQFVITDISESIEDADPVGNIFSYRVSCNLKEYYTPDKKLDEQLQDKKNAAAVGDKKPVAKKKSNKPTCAKTVSGIVTKIENHARMVSSYVDTNQTGSITVRNNIKLNLDGVIREVDNLIKHCDDPKSCAHSYPDIKAKAFGVNNAANTFIFQLTTFGALPPENKKLQASVASLKTAATPLIKTAISGK